jgi:hypothetical protein
MEDIKLAFETVIVGLLAIPWLLILVHLVFYLIARRSILTKAREFVTDSHQSFALVGPLIIGLAYCVGTILFPIADEYFNDPHRFPVHVRDDDTIRVDTLTKIYFDPKHKYYDLSEADFPGLANANDTTCIVKALGPEADKISKKDYDKLKEAIHSIYNYQKFYDYNSGNGYEVLKPLRSRIVVLRGAVLNGLFLLGALLLLFFAALLEVWDLKARAALLRGWGEFFRRSKERIHGLFILLFLGSIVWVLCWRGAWGVAQAEAEYDKHVVGIFYGSRASAEIEKMVEQQYEGNNAGQHTGK